MTLNCLKRRRFFALLSSDEDDCINHDSFFTVIQANREVFEAQEEEFALEDSKQDLIDEVRVIFENEKHVNALMCTSPKNNCSNIFPLVKENYEDSTFLDKVRVITNPGNCRSF